MATIKIYEPRDEEDLAMIEVIFDPEVESWWLDGISHDGVFAVDCLAEDLSVERLPKPVNASTITEAWGRKR